MSDLTDAIEAAKLQATRLICRTEGHRWIEVSTWNDLPFRNDICGRGCGAQRHRRQEHATISLEHIAAKLAKPGTTIRSIEIVEDPK